MGARKLKWKEGEECALKAGVEKHGAGKWRTILKDEQFGPILKQRSNVDLKDKWRNMTSTHQPGPRDKKRSRKVKSSDSPNTATAMDCNSPNSTSSSTSVGHQDMIICALRTLQANNPKGSDFNAIHQFIRSHYELPANFKSIMDSRLKEMALKGIVDLQSGVYLLKYDEGQYSSDFSAEHEVSSSQTSIDGNQQTYEQAYDFESIDELLAFDAEDGFELELADPFMDFAEECEAILSDDGPSYSRIFDQFLEQGVVIVC